MRGGVLELAWTRLRFRQLLREHQHREQDDQGRCSEDVEQHIQAPVGVYPGNYGYHRCPDDEAHDVTCPIYRCSQLRLCHLANHVVIDWNLSKSPQHEANRDSESTQIHQPRHQSKEDNLNEGNPNEDLSGAMGIQYLPHDKL